MSTDLISRARAGDGAAFAELTAAHRRELHVHCYRMLGSVADAEDALQDTLLAAWQGLGGFEERASVRTWLYRIATNCCLNARRSAARRPTKEWTVPGVRPPEPTRLGEIVWLEPYPDVLLYDADLGPEALYERSESISLAFVTALQILPPRQRAVLVLRDVLGYPAAEAATILDTTVESATSALKRARAALTPRQDREPPAVPGSAAERDLVAKLVRAYESADVEALVALLTEDITISMPPMPFEYQGIDAVTEFLTTVTFRDGRTHELVPTRANGGQPAFGVYHRDATTGIAHATGIYVLTLAGDRIAAWTRFENTLLPWFGLPRTLAG